MKHNFSVYFYMMYLVEGSGWASVMGLASFIPQLILTVTFGIVYYHDIPFCCFVQTFAFVTFNKVCTSQVMVLNFNTFSFNLKISILHTDFYTCLVMFVMRILMVHQIVPNCFHQCSQVDNLYCYCHLCI